MISENHSPPPWWVEKAGKLRPGQKKRVADGKLVSFNGKAYMMYDFRDKKVEFYEPHLTLAERMENIARAAEATANAVESTQLPDLYSAMQNPQDWPGRARVWMHAAGLSNLDIITMGAYWAPNMQRVILPLDMLDGSSGWIARSVDKAQQPKYLFPAGMQRGGGAFVAGNHGHYEPKRVVLTEDSLSAYRVARSGPYTDAVACLGTSLDMHAVAVLAQRYHSAVVWLDPDKWGQRGAAHLIQQLGRCGMEVRNVCTEVDPKLLSDERIQEVLT